MVKVRKRVGKNLVLSEARLPPTTRSVRTRAQSIPEPRPGDFSRFINFLKLIYSRVMLTIWEMEVDLMKCEGAQARHGKYRGGAQWKHHPAYT